MTTNDTGFFGKYRGIVVETNDPLRLGRIKVQVPDVFGHTGTGWALPCLAPGLFALPSLGSAVWVEFEQGDPDRPIWSGCYLTADQPWPSELQVPQGRLLTNGVQAIILEGDQRSEGITIKLSGNQVLVNGYAINTTLGIINRLFRKIIPVITRS